MEERTSEGKLELMKWQRRVSDPAIGALGNLLAGLNDDAQQ